MDTPQLEQHLESVKASISASLAETAVGPMMPEFTRLVGAGKMLRARLALQLGEACGTDSEILIGAGAGIELVHGASLLHDDVIDGATTRRKLPSFWVEKGVQGAVLLGDLFFCRAVHLMNHLANGRLTGVFVEKVCEMCDGETDQELMLRNTEPSWKKSVSIARRKTGSLFAFVAYAAGGDDPALSALLEESAYDAGTAFQVADDLLDASGDADVAGKTLGTDAMRGKLTAATTLSSGGPDPRVFIRESVARASQRLEGYPSVRAAWDCYVTDEMDKAFETFMAGFTLPEYA
jgi:geranylgeranyl pyrophosphate synthase